MAIRSRPVVAALFRAPAAVYRWHGGRLFGHRLLLVRHRGRNSGRRYDTVLEVVRFEPRSSEAVVVAGFGPGSDWLRNLEANGEAEVTIGPRHFTAVHRIVPEDEAVAIMADYERRNRLIAPLARFMLSRLLGWRYTSSAADRRRLVRQLPMVAFRPVQGR